MRDEHKIPYPPRLNVAITDEQAKALQKHLTWGVRKQIFGKLTDALIESLEEDPEAIISGVLSDKVTFRPVRRYDAATGHEEVNSATDERGADQHPPRHTKEQEDTEAATDEEEGRTTQCEE